MIIPSAGNWRCLHHEGHDFPLAFLTSGSQYISLDLNHLKSSLTQDSWTPHSEFLIPRGLGRGLRICISNNFQVMLLLWAQEPHTEKLSPEARHKPGVLSPSHIFEPPGNSMPRLHSKTIESECPGVDP